MAWDKKNEHHAVQGDWTLTRYMVGGEPRFLLWDLKKMVPRAFEAAHDAVAFAKWVEDNARDVIERVAVKKPLTREQMEVI